MGDDILDDDTLEIFTSVEQWQPDEFAFRHCGTVILLNTDELLALQEQIEAVLDAAFESEENVCKAKGNAAAN